jgi:hypothetical protein
MVRHYTDDDIERVPEPDADAPYEDEDEEPGVFRFPSGEKFIKRIITLHGVEKEFLVGESQSVEKLERQLMRSGYADQFLAPLEKINGGDG